MTSENYERYFVPAIGQPLANALVDIAAAAGLDDEARAAVTREVVASWRPFTQQSRLVLELGFSVASGEQQGSEGMSSP